MENWVYMFNQHWIFFWKMSTCKCSENSVRFDNKSILCGWFCSYFLEAMLTQHKVVLQIEDDCVSAKIKIEVEIYHNWSISLAWTWRPKKKHRPNLSSVVCSYLGYFITVRNKNFQNHLVQQMHWKIMSKTES